MIAGKLLSDGFALAMAVPGILRQQVLPHAGTNIRFILMKRKAAKAFWHHCGTLREWCCGLLLMHGLFGPSRVHVPAQLPSHPSWPRQQSLSCKAGCYACKGIGEQSEWTLIRSKFEDIQYLSSVRRWNISSSSCSDECQTRDKRNSSTENAVLPLSCSPLPSTLNLVLV